MLSVVIATQDSERALLPTLAALVAGAAAGIVRDVIVADAGSRDATLEVAEVAGCRVLSSNAPRGVRLKDAAGAARGRWLLFLQPGIVPEGGWVGETRRFIEEAELDGRGASRAATFPAAPATTRPTLSEAFAMLCAALGAPSHGNHGLVIAKTLYAALGGHRDVGDPERDLVRRLGRRRMVLLRCRAENKNT
jgi:glycosyltransferase involved in cell wall biosynthesis